MTVRRVAADWWAVAQAKKLYAEVTRSERGGAISTSRRTSSEATGDRRPVQKVCIFFKRRRFPMCWQEEAFSVGIAVSNSQRPSVSVYGEGNQSPLFLELAGTSLIAHLSAPYSLFLIFLWCLPSAAPGALVLTPYYPLPTTTQCTLYFTT